MEFQVFRYVVGGRQIELQPSTAHVGVQFDDELSSIGRRDAMMKVGNPSFDQRFEVPNERLTIVPIDTVARVSPSAMVNRIASSSDVKTLRPVFKVGSNRALFTNRLNICIRPGANIDLSLLSDLELSVSEQFGRELVVELALGIDPIAATTQLGEIDWIEYVEPDFMVIGKHPHPGQNDSFSPLSTDENQYAIVITQTDLAWDLPTSATSVRLAVLDDGVTMMHPALSSTLVATYDAINDYLDATPNSWDSHGTASTGIAGAVLKVGGLKGVCGGCDILAVRIAQSTAKGSGWVVRNSDIRRGIDWAVAHGADVFSLSWGGSVPSNAITSALFRARTQGRGGKGCVVTAAAGNAFSAVEFPANLVGVLAVSGTNQLDEFKSPTSGDGETWWGSNYGPEIDIAAPAVNIFTTDLLGADGKAQGDYMSNYNGTSAATPIVAGAAALLLKINPDLTESEVREALTSNADKVGRYAYESGRNNYFGYGRLNVYRAAQYVFSGQSTGGAPQLVPVPDGPPSEIRDRVSGSVERLMDSQSNRASAFGVATDDSEVLVLNPGPPDRVAENLEQYARWAGQRVTLSFSSRVETNFGTVLMDPQIKAKEAATVGNEPPPGQIWLGGSEL
jgi:subtilisin family serine protease